MSPEKRSEIRRLFEVISILDGPERERAIVDVADAEVRAEVAQLLKSDAAAAADTAIPPIFRPAAQLVNAATEDLLPGFKFESYVILQKLGNGGFGNVYKAEERSAVKRIVAIKVIKPGFDTKDVLARFQIEYRLMAMMNHDNIARIFHAGETEKGRPYFVMEYVPGLPITEFADQSRLSIEARLRLFAQVCDAVSHANDRGVVHRDIKASNVLAFESAGRFTAKVIDFGIAKALFGSVTDKRTVIATGRGIAIGTWDAMSPEQAEGRHDIDKRADVYALGVLLYELLSGVKPFDQEMLRKIAEDEIKRVIREVDPPSPSARLSNMVAMSASRIAAARQSRVDQLQRELRARLEWIPLKAMSKVREDRYASASSLAEDIDNYLHKRPLESRRLFVAKNRRRWLVTIMVFLELATPAAIWICVKMRHQRPQAQDLDPNTAVNTIVPTGGTSPRVSQVPTSSPTSAASAIPKLGDNAALTKNDSNPDTLESEIAANAENLLRQADAATNPHERVLLATAAEKSVLPLIRRFDQSNLRLWQVAGRIALLTDNEETLILSTEALERLDSYKPSQTLTELRRRTPPEKVRDWATGRIECLRVYKLAKSGDGAASCSIGYCYENGTNGLLRDYQQAIAWYEAAASQGNALAMGQLADMYDRGRPGVPKSEKHAVKWYRDAANAGNKNSAAILRLKGIANK